MSLSVFRSLDAMEREVGDIGIETTGIDSAGVEKVHRLGSPGGAGWSHAVEGGDWGAFCRSRNQPH